MKEKTEKKPLHADKSFFFYKLACLQKDFTYEYYPFEYFPWMVLWADSVSLLMNNIMSCEQFKTSKNQGKSSGKLKCLTVDKSPKAPTGALQTWALNFSPGAPNIYFFHFPNRFVSVCIFAELEPKKANR